MKYFEKLKSEKEIIEYLHEFITEEKHMIFDYKEIANIYYSLKSQRLAILNSRPGMGKTELCNSLVEAFENLLEENTVRKIFLSINKNFDKTDLLGYQGLDEKYHPSYLAKQLFELNDKNEPQTPKDFKMYFVILDEMNLSQIDFYFSTMLAAIENRENIVLPNGIEVSLPNNCFFIGTINSFTYESSRNPVSGSVKRRANVINIKNPLDKIFEKEEEETQYKAFKNWVDELIEQSKNTFTNNEDFINHFRELNFQNIEKLDKNNFYYPLFELTKSLSDSQENKLTFGILQDIVEYVIFADFNISKSLDLQIVQKILPSLTGSIKNLEKLENIIEEYEYEESLKLLNRMLTTAKNNMGQIVPLC